MRFKIILPFFSLKQKVVHITTFDVFPENKEKSLEILFRQACIVASHFLFSDIPRELLSLNRSKHAQSIPPVKALMGQWQ